MLVRFLVAAALMLCATGAVAQAPGTRIGFVDAGRIEREAVTWQRAMEAQKKEFAPRETQIVELQKQITAEQQRLEKEAKTLSATDLQTRRNALQGMMRKSDQLVNALAEDMKMRTGERIGKLSQETNAAIRTVAEAGKFDLIVQQATYVHSGIDITEQVLKELARRTGK